MIKKKYFDLGTCLPWHKLDHCTVYFT